MDDIIKKLDLYELLDITIEAEEPEIKKAYRKKALKCHPDKNPDDPKAAETFRQLSKALEILSDEKARNAYNKILKARKEQQLRNKNLDNTRKRLKEELEARERNARDDFTQKFNQSDEERLKQEIERLRKEGSKILEQENDYLRKQIEKEIEELKLQKAQKPINDDLPRLKCKWDRTCNLDEKQLRAKFETCGQISALVISKKNNSAMVEFEHTDSAVAAYNLRNDQLKIEWVQGKPANLDKYQHNYPNFNQYLSHINPTSKSKNRCFYDIEYEQQVINKLRKIQKDKNKNI